MNNLGVFMKYLFPRCEKSLLSGVMFITNSQHTRRNAQVKKKKKHKTDSNNIKRRTKYERYQIDKKKMFWTF